MDGFGGWLGVAVAAVVLLGLLVLRYRERRLLAAQQQVLQDTIQCIRSKSNGQGVALVTGANSGIGLELCAQLARADLTVVLACRSEARGTEAIRSIEARIPNAKLELLVMDVSDLNSIAKGVQQFAARHSRLDYLFQNAGVFPHSGYRWGVMAAAFCKCAILPFFQTGRSSSASAHFLRGDTAANGRGAIPTLFATHVLGPYVLAKALKPQLDAAPAGKIIWTGSRAATTREFSWDDITARASTEAYGITKYETDLISHALNKQFRQSSSRVISYVCCPGFVDTGVTPGVMVPFLPIFRRVRSILDGFSVFPEIGCLVLLVVAAGDHATIPNSGKLVLSGTRVTVATRGSPKVTDSDSDRLVAACDVMSTAPRQ